ncbi:MAG: hypothetical protein KJP11_08420 [Gammaproteobacteria bacterium]|nr:hypothetical protein [Gammaproteobacteria bacterium]
MKFRFAGFCLALAIFPTQASERWTFDSRISITDPPVDAVYHHLEGSGRKHIAVSGESVAVVWEDNRSRDPQIYAAIKSLTRKTFPTALLVSSGSEAYEPAIDAINANRFVLAFEQDASVFARIMTAKGLAEPVRLSRAAAGHVSIASFDDRVFASWRERDNAGWFIKIAALRVTNANRIVVESLQSVEADGLETPVLFPAVAVNSAGICIAWEDRRAGHTRLLVSHARAAGNSFTEPQFLNEFFSNRNQYDRGSGVTRVSLASFAQDEILAAWMDKRRGGKGYGIFAALGADAGESFGPNEKVHGEEGDTQPHYNPATAGNQSGDFVIAWDDFRRGDSDIWISAHNPDLEWSLDYAPPVASGNGEQSHPSIALDEQGNLHLVWIERAQPDGPSRLWYSLGRALQQP